MNTDLRRKAKNDFEKDFFKLMNNAVFGKTIGNLRKHRDTKLVTRERKINYLVSEPSYNTKKFFTENIQSNRNEKTEILINKPVYLRPSMLELNKILLYELWQDCVRPKYG